MTGVATLKDPRQSAIAGTASLSLSFFSSLSLPLLLSAPCLLGNSLPLAPLLPLTVGLGDTRVPYSTVNHGRWEAESVRSARQRLKLKLPTPKRRPPHLHIFGRAFFPAKPIYGTSWRGPHWTITLISLPGDPRANKNYLTSTVTYPVFKHPYQFVLSHRSWSRENCINTVKMNYFPHCNSSNRFQYA